MTGYFANTYPEDREIFPFNMFSRGARGAGRKLYGRRAKNEMKSDMQEHESSYTIDIDLPGFRKDQILVDLEDGYLTVTAQKRLDRDDRDSAGRLIRQERFTGEMHRSFYVGDEVAAEDVQARYADGVLRVEWPKPQEEMLPEARRIRIAD